MQVTETAREGLKRTLQVVIGKAELSERFSERLDQIKGQVQIKGFRKGKVPVEHLRKLYGRSLMQEVVEKALNETSSQAIKDRNERPAQQPKLDLAGLDDGAFDRIVNGEGDLAYSMSFEVLPPIPVADLKSLSLERFVVDVDDASIEKALQDLADRNTAFEPEDGRAASEGDLVTMDFVGSINGEKFEGGSAENQSLVLGRKQFIPGFEEGLTGVKAGEDRVVTATFPDDYMMKDLAGKTAHFDVKVTAVSKPRRPEIDEEFAKGLGTENLETLRKLVSEQISREYEGASRAKLKREILDALDKAHNFELPASLVDFEFNTIWEQLQNNLKATSKTLADEGKSEEEARAEYRGIAERRVRLGLVIGEIGEKNKLQISQDELRRALVQQARRYPGREKQVYEFYEKTPGALNELRAPLFEDKVMDLIIEEAKPIERKVSRDELMKALEEVSEKDAPDL